MANKNYFMSGVTELIILALLKKTDCYVYEIIRTIEEYSGGLLSISQNTIYTATYKLEKEKKISEYTKLVGKKRTRVYYHIEDEGLKALDELVQNFGNVTDGVKNIFKTINLFDDNATTTNA